MNIQEVKNAKDLDTFFQEREFKPIVECEKYQTDGGDFALLHVIEIPTFDPSENYYREADKDAKNDANYLYHLIVDNDYNTFVFLSIEGEILRYKSSKHYDETTLKSLLEMVNNIWFENYDYGLNPSIERLFDVKPLVDKFYTQYKLIRHHLITSISGCSNAEIESQTILDRIIFLYFLQAHRILPERYLQTLMENMQDDENYWRDYFAPLAFEVLNVDKTNRTPENVNKFPNIPYLNGGLFSRCLGVEIAGNTDLCKKIQIPDDAFREIFDLFDGYEWVISEDDRNPLSITPEVLGYIYERSITDQQETGSFYTPAQITSYLTSQTIIPLLTSRLNEKTSTSYSSVELLLDNFSPSPDEISHILVAFEILKDFTICDNACGSGAFLLAAEKVLYALHEKCLRILIPNNQIPDDYREIRRYSTQPYWVKKYIITRNLYGVDINAEAVEIAKLRLWLSMVSEMDPERLDEIEPLPNIDYNIMVGNSLVGFIKLPKQWNEVKRWQEFKEAKNSLDELGETKRLYRKTTSSNESYQYKSRIEELSNTLRKILNGLYYEKYRNHPDFTEELKQRLIVFHWVLEFYDVFYQPNSEGKISLTGGFDIIFGNPPYIKEYTNREAFDGVRQLQYFQGKMDIWYLFACQALDLLKKGGLLGYIAQNNWISSFGAKKLRQKIITETMLRKFIDFHDYKVFKTAGIQTMIFITEKTSPPDNYLVECRQLLEKKVTEPQLYQFLRSEADNAIYLKYSAKVQTLGYAGKPIHFLDNTNEEILDFIASRDGVQYLTEAEVVNGTDPHQYKVTSAHLAILGSGYALGEGIVVLNENERNSIPFNYEEQQKFVKPFYTKDQFMRYNADETNTEWILYTPSNMNSIIDEYPNIKAHFDRYLPILTSDFGPYGIHRARDPKFFVGERIFSLRKCARPTFTYVTFEGYVGQAFYIIKTSKFELKSLTGFLNSDIVAFWLKYKGKMQGGQYQVDQEPILAIPILPLPSEISVLTSVILFLRALEENSAFWEKLEDYIIFEMFFLKRFIEDGFAQSSEPLLLNTVSKYIQDLDPDIATNHDKPDKSKIQNIRGVESSIQDDPSVSEMINSILKHPWISHIENAIPPS